MHSQNSNVLQPAHDVLDPCVELLRVLQHERDHRTRAHRVRSLLDALTGLDARSRLSHPCDLRSERALVLSRETHVIVFGYCLDSGDGFPGPLLNPHAQEAVEVRSPGPALVLGERQRRRNSPENLFSAALEDTDDHDRRPALIQVVHRLPRQLDRLGQLAADRRGSAALLEDARTCRGDEGAPEPGNARVPRPAEPAELLEFLVWVQREDGVDARRNRSLRPNGDFLQLELHEGPGDPPDARSGSGISLRGEVCAFYELLVLSVKLNERWPEAQLGEFLGISGDDLEPGEPDENL